MGTDCRGRHFRAAAPAAALHQNRPHVVAHFAAHAYVGKSVESPGPYYRNNSFGTLVLLEEMLKGGVDKLILSSTCASYGVPIRSPIDEMHPQSPINPYGWSKFSAYIPLFPPIRGQASYLDLVKATARAYRWQWMPEQGTCTSPGPGGNRRH
jgi:hypothetical protein